MEAPFEKMRFSQVYQYIKLNGEFPYKPEAFIEKAKIFSIPMLERIMILMFIVKIIIAYIYFISFEKTMFSFTLLMNWSCIIGIIVILLVDNNENSPLALVKRLSKVISPTNLQRLLNIYIIIVFFFEENYSQYYYPEFNFQVNPGFIFFLYLSIAFFDSQNFSYIMFYLYIWNLILLIHYMTLRNFFNFYIPINLVFGMFTLVNVIAHNIGTKISKSETFFKFYETLLSVLFKELEMVLTYNKKIILPNDIKSFSSLRKKSTKVFDNIISDSFCESFANLSQDIDAIPYNYKKIPLAHFENFEIAFKRDQKPDGFCYSDEEEGTMMSSSANPVLSFINLLFFLKNHSKCKEEFLLEIGNIIELSLKLIKSVKLQELLKEIGPQFDSRDKMLMIVICFLLEAVHNDGGSEVSVDELIIGKEINMTTKTISIEFNPTSKMKMEKIMNMIQELSKDLNFALSIINTFKFELRLMKN